LNKAHEELTGYSEEDIAAMKIWDIQWKLLSKEYKKRLSKEQIKDMVDDIETDPSSTNSTDIEIPIVKKDGTKRYILQNAFPIKSKTGVLYGSINYDITELKNVQNELKLSEEKFRSSFEASEVGMAIINESGKFISVNIAACKILEYTKKEILQKTFIEITHPDDIKRSKDKFYESLIKKKPYTIEKSYITKSGSKKIGLTSVSPVFDSDGNFLYAIAHLQDITSQKLNEKRLKKSEEKYRTLIESSNDMIFVIKHGIILFANQRLIKTSGYSEKEIIGKPFINFVEKKEQEKIKMFYQKRLRNEPVPNNYESKAVTKDGKIVEVEIVVVFIEYEGQIAEHVVMRDITERKIIEKELKENERLLNEVGNIAKIGGWEIDIKTKKATWTKGTYDIVEIDYDDEIPGLDDHVSFYLPEYRQLVENSVSQLIEHGGQMEFEAKLKTAKGNIKWCKAFGKREMQNDVCIKIFGTFQDITKEKTAQIELIKANEKSEETKILLKSIINAIPDLIWLKDIKGVYLNCNKRFEDFFGKKENEINGKTDYDFVDKELADFFRKNDKIAMNADKPIMNEEEITFALDGHSEILETIKTPVYNKNKDLIGVLGVGRDITQRKNAEEELKKYQNDLEKLVKARTNELEVKTKDMEEKNKELERYNELFIGREFRIKELRDKVKELESKLKYK
jgi:PAS domain S-box-containing protein